MQRIGAQLEQLVVECLLQPVVLRRGPVPGGSVGQFGHVQDGGQVQALGLPVRDRVERMERADDEIWHDEWMCPVCRDRIYLDVPGGLS